MVRGKDLLEQLSRPRFFTLFENRALFFQQRRRAIFELRKKRGFKSCSNIPFPLVVEMVF